MSVENLIPFIRNPNIAELLDEQKLMKVGQQVVSDFDRDLDSMSEWADGFEEGQEIARQETQSKSEPWEGASNFKSPAILDASISFGNRAQTELLRGNELVKSEVIGSDPAGEKQEAADRVTAFMNYQINHEMKNWREQQGRLFYEISAGGAVFKKSFYDPIDGVNKITKISFPDFAVNQATSTIDEALSFTHIMDFSVNQAIEKIRGGIWIDVQLYPDNSDSDEGSNESEDVDFAFDNSQQFLEQLCYLDLDDDGYAEPYVATVHRNSGQVVRIVARYEESEIIVRDNETGQIRPLLPGESGLNVTLVRIKALNNITKYGFIPDPDGRFLDVGYYHLLAGMSKGINATANQLIDAGTLSNLQGGFLAKGFRKRMGNLKVKPGAWESTDISAQDLAAGVQPYKFKEPSPTLLSLNESMRQIVRDMSLNIDLKGVLAPNAPATTTLGMIQEAMLPTSAILQRITMAESDEFQKLFVLDSKFSDPIQYQNITDDPNADFAADFNQENMNIKPTANPEMSSRFQRIQLGEAVFAQADRIAQAGGDVRPIIDFWLKSIGADEVITDIFPSVEQMTEEQAQRIAQQQQVQNEQRELVLVQINQAQQQIDTQKQIAFNDSIRAENDRLETLSKLRVDESTIQKNIATALLDLEKAETEDTKNKISVYTAQLEATRQAIDNTIKQIEVERADRQPVVEIGPVPPREPDQPGAVLGVVR